MICVVDGTNNDVVDDVTHSIMDDVMLKREAATEFYDREPRNLYHECYAECCRWEEVRESYKHNIAEGVRLIIFVLFYLFHAIFCPSTEI